MKIRFLLLMLTISISQLMADTERDTSTHQFLISYEDEVQGELLTLLEDMNAEEVWEIDDLGIALWQVKRFPFVDSEGETVYDIKGLIRRARLRTRIKGFYGLIRPARLRTRIKSIDFNHEVGLPSERVDSVVGCFDPSKFQVPTGKEEVKIAILDTGISDISDNSTSQYNYNLTSYSGYGYVRGDENPDDEHGHGSHVAGIIHSIAKFNPNTNIKFDIRKTHDREGKAFIADIVLAAYEAIEDDADIINMSFGATQDFTIDRHYPLQTVIKEAEDEDVLVVVAAGNEGRDNDNLSATSLPASFPEPNIVAVAAGNCQSQLAPFSNYGKETVDVITYGEQIPGPDLGAGITRISGTSQSSAIVSAVAALIATNKDADEYEEIKCKLTQVGTPVYNLNGGATECVKKRNSVTSENGQSMAYLSGNHIIVKAHEIHTVAVYNAIGELVHKEDVAGQHLVRIPTSSLSGGVYFVKFNNTQLLKIVLPV